MHRFWLRLVTLGIAVMVFGTLGTPDARSEPALGLAAGGHTCKGKKKARKLVNELRQELAPVEQQIRNHPYIDAVEAGQVSLDNLRAFAGEQYLIIQSDLRSAAQLVARYGATRSGAFFQGILEGEIIAFQYLLDFAAALGWDERELKAYEPNPQAQTYPSYVTWMSVNASAAQVAAAFLLNFAVFGENLGRMATALRSQYGLSQADTAFFDFFAELPPDFERDALKVIGDGLCKGVKKRQIKRSARLLQAYELDFWDAVAEN